MKKIYTKIHDILEIGYDFPTVMMGVINLSPESFYKGSVYVEPEKIKNAALEMVKNGADILDIGGRSTAPWSDKISIEEEVNRMKIAMENVCGIIPDTILISVDTQYRKVAEVSLELANKYQKKIIINDVSSLKTDPSLEDFVVDNDLPLIIMASKDVPGDLLTIEQIMEEFKITIERLSSKGYNENQIILDPGIGRWIKQKIPEYDLKILANLEKLRVLNKPILIAVSRKSFIGVILNKPDPSERLYGSLSATAISVFNGAHIIRTHDVDDNLSDILKLAYALRRMKE